MLHIYTVVRTIIIFGYNTTTGVIQWEIVSTVSYFYLKTSWCFVEIHSSPLSSTFKSHMVQWSFQTTIHHALVYKLDKSKSTPMDRKTVPIIHSVGKKNEITPEES